MSKPEKGPLSADETSLEELRKTIESGEVEEVSEDEESTEETSQQKDEGTASEADSDDGVEEPVTPPEQTETKSEEWFVPGQFKTKDDFIRSYKELQGAFTRTTQELSKFRNSNETTTRQAVDPKDEIRNFASKIEANPIVALRELAREEAAVVAEQQEAIRVVRDNFVSEYQNLKQNAEFKELEPLMCQIAEEFAPLIKNQNDEFNPKLLHALFWMAKGVRQDKIIAQERQKAELKGEFKARKKQRVQVEGGSSTRGQTKKNNDDMSLDELRAAINRGELD